MSSDFGITAKRSLGFLTPTTSVDPPHAAAASTANTMIRFMRSPITSGRARSALHMSPLKHLVHHDDDDNNQADDEALIERRTGDLRQRVAQHAKNQRAEDGADDRSASAREARAADHRGRDDVELVAHRQIGLPLPLHD